LNDITDVTGDVFLDWEWMCGVTTTSTIRSCRDYFRLQAFYSDSTRDELQTSTANELAEYQVLVGAWEEKTARSAGMAEIENASKGLTIGHRQVPEDVRPMLARAPGALNNSWLNSPSGKSPWNR
jgi:hypothetical protein